MSSKPTKDPRLWRTLAFRLTALYAAAGLLLVLLAGGGLYLLLVAELDKSTDLFLADKLNVLRTMLRDRPDDTDALREEIELETAARKYERFYIRLLDAAGRPLLTTPGMAAEVDPPDFAKASVIEGRSGRRFRVASAAAVSAQPARRGFTIQIAIDVSQEEQILARFRLGFLVVLLGTAGLFPVAGYQIARQGIGPMEAMASTARRITSSRLGERIDAEGYPSELASLAGTFNTMLDGLQESFERISRFSADIAHDLRTPVNNIRGEAEVALARARTIDEYRDALGSSLEEAVRLSDLIGDLLFLARTESPLTHLRRERVDVGDLLAGVRDYYDASAADGGVALRSDAGGAPVLAELDRSLMQRAIGNLISNAVAHTLPGGAVVLQAAAEPSAVRIEVADTGVGIPKEALPRVFDRFYRVDPSRSRASGGTGLGLSIVHGIVLLHGGQVEIASEPGRGTRVTLRLPVAAAG